MNGFEPDKLRDAEGKGAVHVYCMAALVADEASLSGFRDFAQGLETLLGSFLASLPRADQEQALRLSYEMALRGEDATPPRLRLVSSRD